MASSFPMLEACTRAQNTQLESEIDMPRCEKCGEEYRTVRADDPADEYASYALTTKCSGCLIEEEDRAYLNVGVGPENG